MKKITTITTSDIVLLTCLCLLVASTSVSCAKSKYRKNNPECTSKYLQKTSLAVAKLMGFGPNGRKFPETQAQLASYCRETSSLVDQIELYFTKCYKKEIKDMGNVLLYSIKSNIRTFCRKKTKKLSKLMSTTPCINNLIHDDRCLVQYANNTKQLIPLKVDDLTKIRYTCW